MPRSHVLALSAALVITGSAVVAPAAVADIITFQFQGSVVANDVPSGPFAAVPIGETARLEYSFDSEAAPFHTEPPWLAYYEIMEGTISMSFGSLVAEFGPQPEPYLRSIAVVDNNTNDLDLYAIGARSDIPGSPGAFQALAFALTDFDGTVFNSTTLPLNLDLGAFEDQEGLYQPMEGGTIHFVLDTLDVVPGPAAWPLLALSGLAVIRHRRR